MAQLPANANNNNDDLNINGKVRYSTWLLQMQRIETLTESLQSIYFKFSQEPDNNNLKMNFIDISELIYNDLYPTLPLDYKKILEGMINKLIHYYKQIQYSDSEDELNIYNSKFKSVANLFIRDINVAKQNSGLGLPVEQEVDLDDKINNALDIEPDDNKDDDE